MANKKVGKVLNSKSIANIIENWTLGSATLASFLQRKELQNFLPSILNILNKKRDRQKQKNIFQIFTKQKLSDQTVDKIIQSLEKNGSVQKGEIDEVKEIIDDGIIAGVKIKFKDLLVDATLNNKLLKALKQ